MKKNILRKHNDIIEACYALKPSELRVLYSCISKITFDQSIPELPQEQALTDSHHFTVNAIEYAETFNLTLGNARRDMKKAVDRLWEQDITIKNGGNDGTDLTIRWLSSKTNPLKKDRFKNDSVILRFSSDVICYLTNLKKQGNFTRYSLESIADLQSRYSIRLFEILKKIQKSSPNMIELALLKEQFCLESKYKRIKDFKVYVLDKAVKEINEKTDIKVSYENVKHGRSIVGFMFTIKSKKKNLEKPKNNKKWLTEADIKKRAQEPKFQGKSWSQVYDILEKEGAAFKRTHK